MRNFPVKLEETDTALSTNILFCLERHWGIKLPKKYREFLTLYNGGYPVSRTMFHFKNSDNGSIIDAFLGINTDPNIDLLWHISVYNNRFPTNMFPMASDPGGNLILISVKMHDYGKVYFWDHEMEADEGQTPDYSNLTLIADSFEEFINNLKKEDEIVVRGKNEATN